MDIYVTNILGFSHLCENYYPMIDNANNRLAHGRNLKFESDAQCDSLHLELESHSKENFEGCNVL